MRITAAILIVSTLTMSGATIRNDDSCDIATFPAATLLLPYFEVDINSPQTTAATTLFTVVNTSREERIARVTLWTDLAYPVMSFNIVLTGYDVQAVNLYDVISMGRLPATGPTESPICGETPRDVTPAILSDLRTALTTGRLTACGSGAIGTVHTNAIGYITIDTVATCSVSMPNEITYYNDLLYDNVLTGDYEWVNPNPTTGNLAGGNPLVHIRAIPEGGREGVLTKTDLPYTFYDLYTPRGGSQDWRAMDRRQPLPHAFIARFIQGGTGAFNTDLRIWREGIVPTGAGCSTFSANNGSAMKIAEVVRFDEHENPTIHTGWQVRAGPPQIPYLVFPAASSTPTSSGIIPPLSTSGDLGGFIYINLNNETSSSNYSAKEGAARATQSWVVVSMTAQGRFQTAFDATPLANGCSPAPAAKGVIGP